MVLSLTAVWGTQHRGPTDHSYSSLSSDCALLKGRSFRSRSGVTIAAVGVRHTRPGSQWVRDALRPCVTRCVPASRVASLRTSMDAAHVNGRCAYKTTHLWSFFTGTKRNWTHPKGHCSAPRRAQRCSPPPHWLWRGQSMHSLAQGCGCTTNAVHPFASCIAGPGSLGTMNFCRHFSLVWNFKQQTGSFSSL